MIEEACFVSKILVLTQWPYFKTEWKWVLWVYKLLISSPPFFADTLLQIFIQKWDSFNFFFLSKTQMS